MPGGVNMPFLEIVKATAPLAAIFGLFTLIIHIYQTRILRRWRDESREDHRRHEEMIMEIKETQRYIADLIVAVPLSITVP